MESWIQVDPTSGFQSESGISVVLEENYSNSPRTGSIKVKAVDITKTITITQEGSDLPEQLEFEDSYEQLNTNQQVMLTSRHCSKTITTFQVLNPETSRPFQFSNVIVSFRKGMTTIAEVTCTPSNVPTGLAAQQLTPARYDECIISITPLITSTAYFYTNCDVIFTYSDGTSQTVHFTFRSK